MRLNSLMSFQMLMWIVVYMWLLAVSFHSIDETRHFRIRIKKCTRIHTRSMSEPEHPTDSDRARCGCDTNDDTIYRK